MPVFSSYLPARSGPFFVVETAIVHIHILHSHMKQKFLFGLLLAVFSIFAPAPEVQAQRYFDVIDIDTIANQDTIVVTTQNNGGPVIIETPYRYSVHVVTDSLSGANAGTVYLQVSNDRNGTVWYNAQSLTLDGATQQSALWEGILDARRIRVYYISPSGTRSVRVQTYASFKKLQ